MQGELSQVDHAAQWSECLQGMQEVLDSSPGQAIFLPCDNLNRLSVAIQMSTHNICFYGELEQVPGGARIPRASAIS